MHGSDGGYLVEMSVALLQQPCLLLGKDQQWVAVRQLVLDSSMGVALAIVSKTGHLWQS